MTDQHYEPIDSGVTPRFAGHSTFMRLPIVSDPRQLEIAIAGVPWDGGTTNRPGPRHGPRQVREMSSLIKRVHFVTKVSPYELCRVADFGDAPSTQLTSTVPSRPSVNSSAKSWKQAPSLWRLVATT